MAELEAAYNATIADHQSGQDVLAIAGMYAPVMAALKDDTRKAGIVEDAKKIIQEKYAPKILARFGVMARLIEPMLLKSVEDTVLSLRDDLLGIRRDAVAHEVDWPSLVSVTEEEAEELHAMIRRLPRT